MYSLILVLHALLAVVWVGGMVFAWSFQRPAMGEEMDGSARQRLWVATFRRFFPWVWVAVIGLPVTGYGMIFGYMGGMEGAGLYIHLMNGLGFLMIALYLHVFFAPYRKLRRAVGQEDWQAGSVQVGRIRRTVAVNMVLGLVVFAVAIAGPHTPLLA